MHSKVKQFSLSYRQYLLSFFFFNVTATTEIYTLSLHDALPISNHPVKDLESGRVQVTAQNHEVEVVGETLPPDSGFTVSQRNLNDGSVEGLRHQTKPIETVQYHPEGSPGPLDALEVFDRFLARVMARQGTP